MARHRTLTPRIACLVAALCAGSLSHAGIVAPAPDYYWVGPGCQFSTLQAAINAADASDGDVIHLVSSAGSIPMENVAAVVDGKTIEISGGHSACGETVSTGRTTLRHAPAGTPGAAVLEVRSGANVRLRNVGISAAGDASPNDFGGGIRVINARLRIDNASVFDNAAQYGGGIAVDSLPGGQAELVLGADVSVSANRAQQAGGGIYLTGNTVLRALEPRILISGNRVTGDGGGIAVDGGATALIGSGNDPGQPPMLFLNHALRGGAIAVGGQSGFGSGSQLRVFATDPRRPPVFRGNSADSAGGAIHAFGGDNVVACVASARLEGNLSADGAAVYVQGDDASPDASGPSLLLGLRPGHDCDGRTLEEDGAVACLPGVSCNTVHDHLAAPLSSRAKGGSNFYGSVFGANGGGALTLIAQDVRDNAASGALVEASAQGRIGLIDTVMVQNTAQGPLLRSVDDGYVSAMFSTLANNLHNDALATNDGMMHLVMSVLDSGELPLLTWDSVPDGVIVKRVLARNLDGVPAPIDSLATAPRFANAGGGNYRLAPDSLAIDYAAFELGWPTPLDADGTARGHDAPRANRNGAYDLGAYEWTPDFLPRRLFGDGLEAPPESR